MEIKYPKGEIVWVTYHDSSHNIKFIITSKPSRETYFLYELNDSSFKKIGKSSSPDELENKYVLDHLK